MSTTYKKLIVERLQGSGVIKLERDKFVEQIYNTLDTLKVDQGWINAQGLKTTSGMYFADGRTMMSQGSNPMLLARTL